MYAFPSGFLNFVDADRNLEGGDMWYALLWGIYEMSVSKGSSLALLGVFSPNKVGRRLCAVALHSVYQQNPSRELLDNELVAVRRYSKPVDWQGDVSVFAAVDSCFSLWFQDSTRETCTPVCRDKTNA